MLFLTSINEILILLFNMIKSFKHNIMSLKNLSIQVEYTNLSNISIMANIFNVILYLSNREKEFTIF